MISGLFQHGLVFSAETLKPQLSKLSLIKGLQRQFSLKNLVEFLKALSGETFDTDAYVWRDDDFEYALIEDWRSTEN